MATTVELEARRDRDGFSEGDVIEVTLEEGKVTAPRPVGRPKVALDADRIRELYHDKVLPLSKVAAALGVATLTLRKRMDEYGIEVRKRGRPMKDARKFEGLHLELDPTLEESEADQAALEAMLAEEDARLAAEAEAAEKASEESTEA